MSGPLLDPSEAYTLWAPEYGPNPVMCCEERAMLSLLPARLEGLTVLDAGCGTGRYLRHALARGARRAAGLDRVFPMLARARATTMAMASVNSITRPSMAIASGRGMLSPPILMNSRVAQ